MGSGGDSFNFHRLLHAMRGFSRLKRFGRLGLIRDLKDALVDEPLPIPKGFLAAAFFGAAASHAGLAARQFLFLQLSWDLGRDLLAVLGSSDESVTIPLPQPWRALVSLHGFRIDRREALYRWVRFLWVKWYGGIRLCVSLLWEGVRNAQKKHAPADPTPGAYFFDLKAKQLPRRGPEEQRFDIVSWYCQWPGRNQKIKAIYHSVAGVNPVRLGSLRVDYRAFDELSLRRWIDVFYFFVWALWSIPFSAMSALCGNWVFALLLAEAAQARAMRYKDRALLGEEYLFHFSSRVYRPLWTYEVAARGCRVICYFYSTYEQPKLLDGYKPLKFEFAATSWPLYLVWDQEQADFISRECGTSSKVEIVGPIWFTDSPDPLPDLPERSIAVFDTVKHRPARHFDSSTWADYFEAVPHINSLFIGEILEVLREHGCTMVFKTRKSDPANIIAKSYKSMLKKLAQLDDVIVVNPDISAIRLIKNCKGTISIPFTSTAVHSVHCGTPAIFYDPAHWVQHDDRAARGIPIISRKEELGKWIEAVLGRSG